MYKPLQGFCNVEEKTRLLYYTVIFYSVGGQIKLRDRPVNVDKHESSSGYPIHNSLD